LLNADQHLGHRRLSSQILAFNHFSDRAVSLLLALVARFRELAGTISATVSTAVDHAGTIDSIPKQNGDPLDQRARLAFQRATGGG
jgi:hypothetical protein